MPDDDIGATDTQVPLIGSAGAAPIAEQRALHLVVVWFLDEPERVGQVAAIVRDSWLGRPHPGFPDDVLLDFVVQRPGLVTQTPPLSTTTISRRQLRIAPLGIAQAEVENAGKRLLFHNGREVSECTVQAGDTLMLENSAVFLVEERPRVLPMAPRYGDVAFPFGTADPQGLVGESPQTWALREQLAGTAAADGHALIVGETGAGKELAAAVLHALSPRARGPLVARNAATIPETLVDAELFGSARNYPNAGVPEREGMVGAANGGHLMLDEIGELPHALQAHLLRLLDGGGQYHRLGETRARVSDLRLIAVTNRDTGALKDDFLARFAEPVRVSGLNERRSDVPLLLDELMRRKAKAMPALAQRFMSDSPSPRPRVAPALLEVLVRHRYSHHTRELGRLLQISLLSSPGEVLELTAQVLEALQNEPAEAHASPSNDAAGPRASSRSPAEPVSAEQVRDALSALGGNVTRAAERLRMSRHALHRLIKRYGLERLAE
jgi:DNA-binding NtrC family response regulator